MPPPNKPEGGDLFAYLAEHMIRRIEQQPIQLTIQFADGVRTYELAPGDPWYEELSKRRSAALRTSLAKLRGKGGKL